MKLIEAMKQIKSLTAKAEDLRKKVAQYCADLDFETPTYGTADEQRETVKGWIQSHSDVLKEILRLRVAIQRTNLATPVTLTLGEKTVTKSIAEWIHRRRDLATLELESWKALTDRNLKEGQFKTTAGDVRDMKIRRYYSPAERDRHLEWFRSEPLTIDATLEVVNAVTDLIEA
jgi:hypothetical protein